jgi:hypothetical protein
VGNFESSEESDSMSTDEIPLLDTILPAWQRKEMVIALLHTGCDTCTQVRHRLEKREAILGDPEVFVLLLDDRAPAEVQEKLRAAANASKDQAFIALGNRFLERYAVLDAHSMPADELLDETREWVEVMAQRCAECSLDGAEYR